jgi:hypothetical protein
VAVTGIDGRVVSSDPSKCNASPLKAIYAEGELDEAATCKDYLQVRFEGLRQVSRKLRYYSLPAILAVGYRVRSHRGTQ